MARIIAEAIDRLDQHHKAHLREISDRTLRYVEDLDAIRERAAVMQDEVANRVAESMNKNMYVLAIVATIMLAPDFLTGLLGINVDSLPGSKDTPWGIRCGDGVSRAFSLSCRSSSCAGANGSEQLPPRTRARGGKRLQDGAVRHETQLTRVDGRKTARPPGLIRAVQRASCSKTN